MTAPHHAYEDDDYAFEGRLTDQRDERISPLIVGAAIAGLIAGIFLWGSLASSLVSSVSSVFDDGAGPEDGGAAPVAEETVESLDCAAFGPTRALSAEREALYQEQCVTPTPEPALTPTIDASLNRASCEEIRGTDYRSPEERTWFLANCVN